MNLQRPCGALFIGLLLGLLLCISGCTTPQKSQTTSAQAVDIENRTTTTETDLQKRADIRMQLAISYFQDGKLEVALSELKQALTLAPTFAEAHGVLALVYMQLGEKDLAEQSFQRALQIKPNNSDINSNYGWFLCQNGREAQSLAYFENALKNPLYQQPALAFQNIGICQLKMGNKKAAEESFTRSFGINPGGPVAALNLAKIFFARNEAERARFYINLVNKGPGFTAESLWLGVRVEHKLNNRLDEEALGSRLRREFSTSRETELLIRGAYDD